MSVFPGDMNIGWGFGLELQQEQKTYDFRDEPECDPDGYHPDESQLADPLLAVSELEQRVEMLEGMLKTYFAEAPSKRIFSLEQRITDLEERLRSLVFVVNSLVERDEEFREVQNMTGAIFSALNAEGALSQDKE